MLKRIFLILIVIILINGNNIVCQDINFTQFHTNLLEVNPAYTGSALQSRASINYRNQWPGIDAAFVTYSASFDHYISKYRSGVGLKISNDVQGSGIIKFLNIDAMYSYSLKLRRDFFVIGALQVGYGQNGLNLGKAVFSNMIDPINGPVLPMNEAISSESNGYIDFASGISSYYRDHHFGFAVHHITNPLSIMGSVVQNINRKYSVNYGYTFPIHINGWVQPHFYVSPSFMFQKQGDFDQIIYGTYVDSRPLTYGFWIRQSLDLLPNSLVLLLGYKKNNLKFSYTYDLTISKLIGLTFGTHELGFVYLIDDRRPQKKAYKSLLKSSWF